MVSLTPFYESAVREGPSWIPIIQASFTILQAAPPVRFCLVFSSGVLSGPQKTEAFVGGTATFAMHSQVCLKLAGNIRSVLSGIPMPTIRPSPLRLHLQRCRRRSVALEVQASIGRHGT